MKIHFHGIPFSLKKKEEEQRVADSNTEMTDQGKEE